MIAGRVTKGLMAQTVRTRESTSTVPLVTSSSDIRFPLSKIPRSLEKRLRTRPIGLISKKRTRALMRLASIFLWSSVLVASRNLLSRIIFM